MSFSLPALVTSLSSLFLLAVCFSDVVSSFIVQTPKPNVRILLQGQHRRRRRQVGRGRDAVRVALSATTTKTTLTEETSWNLRFVLRGVSTNEGKKVDEIFSITGQFLEETGYEPPQGSLKQIDITDDNQLKITKGYWKLSEDPNDRKDGLWIWGLFEEPLYPFLLLQIETDPIPLSSGGGNSTVADYIKPLQLYAQINHKREKDVGVVLEASELKVRQLETIKADPFGAATVDVYDEVDIGTLSIQPIITKPTKAKADV